MSEVKTTKKFKELVSFVRAFYCMTPSKMVGYSLAKNYLRMTLADEIACNLMYNRPASVTADNFISINTSDAAFSNACTLYYGIDSSVVCQAFRIIGENYSVLKDGGIPDEVYSAKEMKFTMLMEIDRTVDKDIVSSTTGNAVSMYIEKLYEEKKMSDNDSEYDFADIIIRDLDEHKDTTIDIDCISIHIDHQFTTRVYRYIADTLVKFVY